MSTEFWPKMTLKASTERNKIPFYFILRVNDGLLFPGDRFDVSLNPLNQCFVLIQINRNKSFKTKVQKGKINHLTIICYYVRNGENINRGVNWTQSQNQTFSQNITCKIDDSEWQKSPKCHDLVRLNWVFLRYWHETNLYIIESASLKIIRRSIKVNGIEDPCTLGCW